MTSASDRAEISALVGEAVRAGAGRAAACGLIGLHPRTLSRWSGPEGEIRPDLRPTADRPVPANRLSAAERDRIVEICASPEFASLPPMRISEIPDSDFAKSRTAVSLSPGHLGDGWSLCCVHSSLLMISGFSVWVNPGFSLFRRMLSPFSSMRWALCMMRSRMASAMVGSPII